MIKSKENNLDVVFEFINQVANIPPIIENMLQIFVIFLLQRISSAKVRNSWKYYDGNIKVLQYWLRIFSRATIIKELTIKWVHIDSIL